MTFKIIDDDDISTTYDPSKNKSRNVLTRYERAAIIGMRLEQLARGTTPYIDIKKHKPTTIHEIAELELSERKIPFLIARTLPNGVKEYWKLEDLIL